MGPFSIGDTRLAILLACFSSLGAIHKNVYHHRLLASAWYSAGLLLVHTTTMYIVVYTLYKVMYTEGVGLAQFLPCHP